MCCHDVMTYFRQVWITTTIIIDDIGGHHGGGG